MSIKIFLTILKKKLTIQFSKCAKNCSPGASFYSQVLLGEGVVGSGHARLK